MALGGEAGLFTALPEQAAPERVGCGLPRLRCAERDQLEWRLVSLDGLLAEDHRVRLVWGFAEGLDLTPLLAPIKAVAGRPGHPSADPRILLALWLYATVEGIGSARAVARCCEEHIAFQWLCGGVGMNAKTLADFRVDHGAVLERLLVDSFTALLRTGVASLDRVAQDGMRVRAAAGAASFRRPSTLAVYFVLSSVKVSSSPLSLPSLISTSFSPTLAVPVTFWNCCFRVRVVSCSLPLAPFILVFQAPSTLAGTIQK